MDEIELTYTPQQLEIFFPKTPSRHTIVPKGRRFGATRGAAHASIEWCLDGMPILWGDTIAANITKYVERYFQPALRKNGIAYDWRVQDKVLRIGEGYIDFRSADRPENWEGFGYSKIILNEAGIILKDPYLYTNAVRPMMIDPDSNSELYALGVPKGKVLKDGTTHPFYSLWSKCGAEGFRGLCYSSYDNPLLSKDDIRELENDIALLDPEQINQEIYGQFIDRSEGNPFAHNFDESRHVKPCEFMPNRPLFISMDFNVEPFAFIFYHVWRDSDGDHIHIFDEAEISGGDIFKAADLIQFRYGKATWSATVTGDYNGNAKNLGARNGASHYIQLQRELKMQARQFQTSPNPRHVNSRNDLNYTLYHHPDLRIDPKCTGTIRDLQLVRADTDGSILKANRSDASQRADFMDAVRYAVNHKAVQDWLSSHQKQRNVIPSRNESMYPMPKHVDAAVMRDFGDIGNSR